MAIIKLSRNLSVSVVEWEYDHTFKMCHCFFFFFKFREKAQTGIIADINQQTTSNHETRL